MNKILKTNKKTQVEYSKKDTLVIIGNGFDRWQNLDTSYYSFRRFYLEHRDEIMKRLHIKPITIEIEGSQRRISDVEIIYGDPFHPDELNPDFWNSFESSLKDIDTYRLNMFFRKEKSDLRELRHSIKNAKKILQEAFSTWIGTIDVDEQKSTHRFGKNCVFINFNYTDTLEKRFQISPDDIFHIHGEAKDKNSIIFGHSSHPQLPEPMLNKFGGRFRGLYLAQELLYETDKHVQDNIQFLILFLATKGIMCQDIKKIYVLGHSMAPVDIEYFLFLLQATRVEQITESDSENDNESYFDEFQARMDYIINTVGYGVESSEVSQKAMHKQYHKEQAARNQMFEEMCSKILNSKYSRKTKDAVVNFERHEDAMWHISYYKPEDKQWVEHLMKELNYSNYHVYPTIDECLQGM